MRRLMRDLAALALVICLQFGTAFARSDFEVQQDVVRALQHDGRTAERFLTVTVLNGTVSLSGTVSSQVDKDAAERTARQVEGVTSVNSTGLTIERPITDEDIRTRVEARLGLNAASFRNISVSVSKGIVTLDGNIGTWEERMEASRAVSEVVGVKAIDNNLIVIPATPSESPPIPSNR